MNVCIRIRTPLQGKDIRTLNHNVLVIERYFDPAPRSSSDNPPQSSPPQPSRQPTSSQISATTLVPADPAPQSRPSVTSTKSPPSSTTKATPAPQPEEYDGDPANIDNIVSNAVLEAELKRVEAQIQQNAGNKQEELLDLKQQIELKMNIILVQVQTGQLTQEDYVKKVIAKIAEEKDLARRLAQVKRDWAKAALARAKMMEKELAGED